MYNTCKWTSKSILRDDVPYESNLSMRIACEYLYNHTPLMARLRCAPVFVSVLFFVCLSMCLYMYFFSARALVYGIGSH